MLNYDNIEYEETYFIHSINYSDDNNLDYT